MKKSRIQWLDAWRGIGCFMVLFSHIVDNFDMGGYLEHILEKAA